MVCRLASRALAGATFALALIGCAAVPPPAAPPVPQTIAEARAQMAAGTLSATALVDTALARIAADDRAGAQVQAVIAVNPAARAEAISADSTAAPGRLNGIPILIKDNIETRELPTTAGSLALASNATGRDSPLVARLRAEGAIILGKTNLSEWANFRDENSVSGWSAIGGLTRNPHSLDRSACGSSSGSGAAVAAGFALAAIGTETNGSITCPSSMNGIVGLKPTVGLVPRTHIVPISITQDTAGPMTQTVRDAAILIDIMAGSDPSDPVTALADAQRTDYLGTLDAGTAGKRIGVLRFAQGRHEGVKALFETALDDLRAAGAELVEIDDFETPDGFWDSAYVVLLTEFRVSLNDYLGSTPPAVTARSLADLIAFNAATPRETALFGQDIFVKAEATTGLTDPAYQAALKEILDATRTDGIDALLRKHNVVALIAPSRPPAFLTDAVFTDQYPETGIGADWLPAIAGYPNLTVPMGGYRGLPVGLSIMAGAYAEGTVLQIGQAFEQQRDRRLVPAFASGPVNAPALKDAVAPQTEQ